MKIDLEDYNIIYIKDTYDYGITGVMLLNKKHTVEEFQNAIKEAKEKHEEDIYENGDDWYYISQELDEFDYISYDGIIDSIAY